jgi:hypothetical protein
MTKEKNRGGRPRLVADDTTTRVSVRLPTRMFDRADARERRARDPVAEQLRRGLQRVLDEDGDD